ncbi:gem-associated protein 2 [Procambarus clarkii]|uniref:gem-associated protein 2 n=1 Tax=Procambarus clarkii TaxID=6728 RepID=UPI001E671C1E|nr:gem-associated protein 2-like [Procambarus clarkii]XP_045595474.1 gem-associated protein 2-like [Procambarus clarkii]XP_045595475.1 gem-associated protein 2-like [Procambarus clarkii]
MASDSDSSDDTLLSQALPTTKVPNDYNPAIPPASAEEYLRHVVWEAKQCQEVVTVDLDRKKLKKLGSIVKKEVKASAPNGYAPSSETQQELLAAFSKLRTQIANLRTSKQIPPSPIPLPGLKNHEEWCKLCFGNSFQLALLKQANKDAAPPPLVEGQQPLMSIVLNIKQRGLQNLLEWHSQWLEVLGFSEPQGRWFYALLACLEKPLTPESCSQIRHIARMCAQIRSALKSSEHPHLPHLNVIICIVARYFNQEDLADG